MRPIKLGTLTRGSDCQMLRSLKTKEYNKSDKQQGLFSDKITPDINFKDELSTAVVQCNVAVVKIVLQM